MQKVIITDRPPKKNFKLTLTYSDDQDAFQLYGSFDNSYENLCIYWSHQCFVVIKILSILWSNYTSVFFMFLISIRIKTDIL